MIIENNLQPTLLIDKSRLQEIYDLRVIAWESSDKAEFINKDYFPNGWRDDLDSEAMHWIIEDEGQIIACARICVLNNMDEMEEDFSQFSLPKARPFAFFSRLVVHPKYRGQDFSRLMDNIRLQYIMRHRVRFVIAYASPPRVEQLVRYGFVNIGFIDHKYSIKADKVDTSDVLVMNFENIK